MDTNTHTTKKHRIRDSLRHVWEDTARANRALFRPPYDDYLQNRRHLY